MPSSREESPRPSNQAVQQPPASRCCHAARVARIGSSSSNDRGGIRGRLLDTHSVAADDDGIRRPRLSP